MDRVDGAEYLFDKKPPSDWRNWKVKLELGQFKHVLEIKQENCEKEIGEKRLLGI